MILSPDQYSSAPVRELLSETARGYVPLDQRLARELIARGPAILPEFYGFLKEPRENDRIDLSEVLLDIARHLRASEALPFYAEMARRAEFSFPDALTEAFVELGASALDTLLELYQESGEAEDVAFALAGLGARDPRVLEVLLKRLEAEPSEGAILLGLYGDPAARPALEKALAAAAGNERLRQELAQAIDETERQDLTEPGPYDALDHFDPEDSPYFAAMDEKELLQFLASPVPAYRAGAVKMLMYDEAAPAVVRAVFDVARQDADVPVRAAAWEALEGVHEPPEIEEAIRAKLGDEAAPAAERASALVALAHEADEHPELRQQVLAFFAEPETRAEAVKAMWHAGDRRFEPQIVKALDDPAVEVRRQAVNAIGILGIVSQLGRLERMFGDEEHRSGALYAYALAAPSKDRPAHLRKVFRRLEEISDGLSEDEALLVSKALDERLQAANQTPVFFDEEQAWAQDEQHEAEHDDEHAGHDHDHAHSHAAPASTAKVGRNDPCPCGSGKKFKKCCGA